MTVSSLRPQADSAARTRRLPSVRALRQALPCSPELTHRIGAQRQAIRRILCGDDPRLLVVIGPCSLHDPQSALEYGRRLAALQPQVQDQLLLVMRAYMEKPRTTVGWKGLLYDPHLDGSHDMARGLELARQLMRDLCQLGLPLATELLHPMAADYLGDLLAWAAIGARTTESQIHREMVSGLELPVGFKNGTDGGIAVATDAMRAAARGHHHLGMDEDGHPAVRITSGNAHTHLVLRGGQDGPNHDAAAVARAQERLRQAGLSDAIMVDCSHGNSRKDPRNQAAVLDSLLTQRQAGNGRLVAAMLESHLEAGQQDPDGPLRYGVSITDGCIGWSETEQLLRQAAARLQQQAVPA